MKKKLTIKEFAILSAMGSVYSLWTILRDLGLVMCTLLLHAFWSAAGAKYTTPGYAQFMASAIIVAGVVQFVAQVVAVVVRRDAERVTPRLPQAGALRTVVLLAIILGHLPLASLAVMTAAVYPMPFTIGLGLATWALALYHMVSGITAHVGRRA